MFRKIGFLALGMFSLGTDLFVIAGILPSLVKGMSISEAAAGQLVTAFAVTYAISAPFLTAIAGKWPRKPMMVAMLAGFALANLGSALASSYGMLLGMRILAALCAALFTPSLPAAAAFLAPPEKRGGALALVNGGLPAALVLGAPLGTWIGDVFGWRMSFLFVFGLAITSAVCLMLMLPKLPHPELAPLKRKLAFAGSPVFRGAWAVSLCWIIGTYALYTYIPQILSTHLKLNSEQITLFLLLHGLASVAGIWLGGIGADRWKGARPIRLSLSLMAVSFLALPLAIHSAVAAAAAVMLWGIGHWSFYPPQQHRLVAIRPADTGTILAFNSSVVYLGQAIGAGLGGLVYAYGGSGIEIAWISAGAAILALFASKSKLYTFHSGGKKHDDSIAA